MSMDPSTLPRLPGGSPAVAQWAAARRLVFTPRPDESWFRRFEPYDTMAPPTLWFNAATWQASPGLAVVAEPWYAPEDAEPLERTIVAYALHPGLVRHAAARVGEHFNSRVAFLESPPPPRVTVGDPLWDEHVATFAASGSEAAAAFHPALRRLLATHGFRGHLEIRPGALVVHVAGLLPVPEHYERLLGIVKEIVGTAVQRAS